MKKRIFYKNLLFALLMCLAAYMSILTQKHINFIIKVDVLDGDFVLGVFLASFVTSYFNQHK